MTLRDRFDQPAAALVLRGVDKAFGSTAAVSGVDLEVRRGEVHALLGENGAGKSTLMKIVAGAHTADAGEMQLFGEPYRPADPADARRRGVAMIYQELTLAPHLTVAENVTLGREPRRCGLLRRGTMTARARDALATLDHPEIEPDAPVRGLGPGARQLVEIGRALAHDARLLVMDEPTSSLGADDVERLFTVIGRVRDAGCAIVYVSHFLEEVARIADRYTTLRDGRVVAAAGAVAEATEADWIEQMAGRRVGEVYPPRGEPGREIALELRGLAAEPLPERADLALRRGEILGIAGLCGAGRSELLRAVFGLAPIRAGTVRVAVAGADADRGAPPWRRLAQGVGLLSEDRKLEGLAQNRSIGENVCLSRLEPLLRHGLVSPRRRRALTARWIERLGIRAAGADQRVADLSGGNQQKVALARLLHHDADVLLLDEPTRGIDVASKADIYAQIVALAASGKAVLMVSSYLPELLGVCHRVAVMRRRGRLGPARPVEQCDEHGLLAEAAGAAP